MTENIETLAGMTKFMPVFIFATACLVCVPQQVSAADAKNTQAEGRIEVRVSPQLRAKMKDITQSLAMAEITPVVDRKGQALCMEVSKIFDASLSSELKARPGDCIASARVFQMPGGKQGEAKDSKLHSVLTMTDAMLLFQELPGAVRVDVDLQRKSAVTRKKEIVKMTYLMD